MYNPFLYCVFIIPRFSENVNPFEKFFLKKLDEMRLTKIRLTFPKKKRGNYPSFQIPSLSAIASALSTSDSAIIALTAISICSSKWAALAYRSS